VILVGVTEDFGEKTVPVPHFPSEIPHELARDRTRFSAAISMCQSICRHVTESHSAVTPVRTLVTPLSCFRNICWKT
jgi:hypothetical protein